MRGFHQPARRRDGASDRPAGLPGAPPECQVQDLPVALQARRWSLAPPRGAAVHNLLWLASGQGRLALRDPAEAGGDADLPLRAPLLAWAPAGQGRWLRLEAGGHGLLLQPAEPLLAAAIGVHADAAALRQLLQRPWIMPVLDADAGEDMARAMRALLRESRRPGAGARHLAAAHLAVLLVGAWRLAGDAPLPPAAARSDARLQQFRRLVEAHFRQRWPVARYAQALGITPDGLHDLCLRKLGRGPRALLQQRQQREACALLLDSARPLQQIAAELGFRGGAEFGRFFRRGSGASPSAWRDAQRRRAASGAAPQPAGYADWP